MMLRNMSFLAVVVAVTSLDVEVLLAAPLYRSPVDCVVSRDGKWLITANQTAGTVSLVDLVKNQVADEIPCGDYPTALVISPTEDVVYVVAQRAQTLQPIRFVRGALQPDQPIGVGMDPYGVAIDPAGKLAYVSQAANSAVAIVDLDKQTVTKTIAVGPWPRTLCLTPDGARLVVACNGDRHVSVIETKSNEVLYDERFGGINAGQMIPSRDGEFVYFPWMVYRQNPITANNIRLGWVLGSRIGRIHTTGSATREAITLDVRGQAVSDPHGLALTSDEKWLVASAGGTHELLVYQMDALVFESIGGPGDHISPTLLNNKQRFTRIPLGGRPLNIRIASDDRTVYVTNYLLDAIQVVDLHESRITHSIALSDESSELTSERLGEAIFYDGRRSLDQWYSCHSCHWEGGTNAVTMDTTNDGSDRTFKTVLSLNNVTRTKPWTWHGWQTDFPAAMRKSMTETMLGPAPNDEDVKSLTAYLNSLESPPSPFLNPDGTLSDAAKRGKAVFHGAKAGCAQCHSGPHFTDGKIHDVGLGSPKDRYDGFNTPSLLGVHRRVRLLHTGRAKSFQELLTRYHKPEDLGSGEPLSDDEFADLIEYLRSL